MRNRTFKTSGLAEENHVFFMKNLWDARKVRARLLECFERAANPVLAEAERHRLLTFVIVGGGPTSVEFAGELSDFVMKDAKVWYPDLCQKVSIKLVEPSVELLGPFSKELRQYAFSSLINSRIEILTGVSVKEIKVLESKENADVRPAAVLSDGGVIPFGMMVWSTGVGALDFVKQL
jgi:NADH dehydrogenase FAD-containing subunit